MGGIRQYVVAALTLASVAAATGARADAPSGPPFTLPSFARMELGAIRPSITALHDRAASLALVTGPDNGSLIERASTRDGFAINLRYALTPWMSLDFTHGLVHARYEADGNPVYLATRVFDQAGATLYPARGWNATLFVNYFKMDTTTEDQGVRGANASFVNARLNHDVSRDVRLSFDVLNVFDKRVNDIDPLASSRLWTDPLISENVLFDASESRGFRLRLRWEF